MSASLEEVCSDALVLTACSGAMSRDCTGVSSITTITGGNGRTCDLTRCGLNPPSGCHSGDGASGPTEGPGVVNLAQLLVSTSGALLTLERWRVEDRCVSKLLRMIDLDLSTRREFVLGALDVAFTAQVWP